MASPLKKRPVGLTTHTDCISQKEEMTQDYNDKQSNRIESDPNEENQENDDDDGYAQFLLSLIDTHSNGKTWNGTPSSTNQIASPNEEDDNEDEDEYCSDDGDDDDEEDEEEEGQNKTSLLLPQTSSIINSNHESFIQSDDDDDDDEEYDEDSWDLDPRELEDELGDLLQEDMEAAILALLQHSSSSSPSNKESNLTHPVDTSDTWKQKPKSGQIDPVNSILNPTPGVLTTVPTDVSKSSSHHLLLPLTRSCINPPIQSSHGSTLPIRKVLPTQMQWIRLHKLMKKQYQLLIQQTVLAVRAAQTQKVHRDKKTMDTHSVGSSSSSLNNSQLKILSMASSNMAPLHVKPLPLSLPMQNPTHPPTIPLFYPPSNKPSVLSIPLTQGTYPKPQSLSNISYPEFFLSGESADEIADILDIAVGMLQDLEKNRKDALRYALQMNRVPHTSMNDKRLSILEGDPNRGVMMSFKHTTEYGEEQRNHVHNGTIPSSFINNTRFIQNDYDVPHPTLQERNILTRAAFSKALQTGRTIPLIPPSAIGTNMFDSSSMTSTPIVGSSSLVVPRYRDTCPLTMFDVKGLDCLYDSLAMIDNSVLQASSRWDTRMFIGQKDFVNVLKPCDHGDACELLLQNAYAEYDQTLLPGRRDLLSLFSYPSEICNLHVKLGPMEESIVRRSRFFFTSGEDNLLLRGVNLYGEKEWSIISNRYMPERGVNLISQRHSKLSVILYEAHGIHISEEGDLAPPAILKHDTFDQSSLAHINPVTPPACINVHRWSLEEDIAILKAVPIIGHSWADISSRLLPHRERGHLRKRYQVLERRVKTTLKRMGKIPSLCDQNKVVSSESISKGKRKLTKPISTSSKKSKNKDDAISQKNENPVRPSLMTAGQGVLKGTGMFVPNHPLLKQNQHFRPVMPGTSLMTNMTPKYVPHGFTAPPLYPLLKQVPLKTVPASSSGFNFRGPSLASKKYSHYTKPAPVKGSSYTHPKSKPPIVAQHATPNLSTYTTACVNAISKQDQGSAREVEEKKSSIQEYRGMVDPTASPSASSFHLSPSLIKLSQIESTHSPSWLSSHTVTSLERLMQVEGLSQMFQETNDSIIMDRNSTLPLTKTNVLGFSLPGNDCVTACNGTWNESSIGPDMEALDNSCSGLSILKDTLSPDPNKNHRSSILSSVLAYSNKGNHDEVNRKELPGLSSSFEFSSRSGLPITSTNTSMLNHPVGFSLDSIDACNMSMYEGSKLDRFDEIGGYTILDDQGIPVCNSLLPPEFDAVAVLNQMSCSNVTLGHKPAIENINNSTTEAQSCASNDIGIKGKGSLFSKVVGGIRDNQKRTGR